MQGHMIFKVICYSRSYDIQGHMIFKVIMVENYNQINTEVGRLNT